MSDVIILRSVYGKVNQTYYIQPCPNPKTGRLAESVKTIDSNGDMILSEAEVAMMGRGEKYYVPADYTFAIVDGTTFDLGDIVDAAKWAAIEHCSWIAKDRSQRDENGNLVIDGNAKKYGVADLYVERPGEMTKIRITKKQLIYKAESYIYEDSESERIKKCRVLGRNLSNAIPADILDYLLEIAEKTPNKIIDLYEGEGWRMQLFIMDAIDRGVIRKSEGIFKYDDKMLGGSMEATSTFLRDIRYKALLDSIKRETYPELRPKQEIKALEDSITEDILSMGNAAPSATDAIGSRKSPSKK